MAGAEAQQGGPEASRLPAVYTAAQAVEGHDIYVGRCKACHTPAAHAETFAKAYSGQPLADAFAYISENMPKDSPGALSPSETLSVISYFLQLLGYPAGDKPLDVAALARTRVDSLTTHSSGEKKP